MKFLDLPALSMLQISLNRDLGDSLLAGRIEAYSCKRAGSDKKLARSLELQYREELGTEISTSPFGPLTESASRKTLLHLVSTLNASYVDYDFSTTSPEQFRKESSGSVAINSVDSTLSAAIGPDYASIRDKIWSTLDTEIQIQRCDVYSYLPDQVDDPFTEQGTIWSINFFFYNRTLKRILYFACRAVSKTASQGTDPSEELPDEDDSEWGDYDREVRDNMEW